MESLNTNKKFYLKLLTLGIPMIFQQLVTTSLNMIDTIMIGSQGETAIAAIGIANRFLFVMIVSLFGVFSGTSIFISQFWGAQDKKNIHKVMGIGMIMGILISFIFTLSAYFIPDLLMDIFIDDPAVISKGSVYLQIVTFSYFPMVLSFAFSSACRSVHKTVTPMISSITGIIINTSLNFLLINGNFGAPALGIKGAAIATLIARIVEIILLLILIYSSKTNPIKAPLSDFFQFDLVLFKKVMYKLFPVFINESAWVIGTTIYFIQFGKLGTGAVTAVQISTVVSDFYWAILFGGGSAAAILIGNEIGKNNLELAFKLSKKTIQIGLLFALLLGVIITAISPLIAGPFHLSKDTYKLAVECIIVMAVFFPIRSYNYLLFVSILRSGGDATFCMVVDLISVWLIGVPATYFSVTFLPITIPVLLSIAYGEEFFKALIVFKRFRSKKWITNLVQ